jgi:hypothetical protein
MKDDCLKIRICPERRPPQPVNVPVDRPPDDSGFLIIRLKAGVLTPRNRDLAGAAKEAGRKALIEILSTFKLASQPLITSIPLDELLKLEQAALRSEFRPARSLSNY